MLVFALEALHRSAPAVPPQLPSSLLAGLAFILIGILFDLRPRTQDITLPTTASDGDGVVLPVLEKEPDVELESALEAFYPRLRIRKLVTSGTFAALLSVELFAIAWDATSGRKDWHEWAERANWIVIWIISLGVSLLAIPHPYAPNSPRSAAAHWRCTLVLFTITTFALSITLLRLILPRSTGLSLLPLPTLPSPTIHIARSLLGATTFLQLVAFLLVGYTPRSAPLYHLTTPVPTTAFTSPEGASITPTSSTQAKPIVLLPSSSPLDYLLFGWITPLLRASYDDSRVQEQEGGAEPMNEASLPALPAAERAVNVWEGIKGTGRFMERENVPRGWNALLWRVVRVNRRLFVWQASLAVTNAVLYYAPAFFLQRLVAFLEDRQAQTPDERENGSIQWGLVYCVGLLMSNVVEAVVSGQLWFVSNSLLATRIRVQLNTLIFDKTLKRKDVSGVSQPVASASKAPSAAAGSEEDDEEDEDAGEKTGFKTKSSIVNLFAIDTDRVADFAIWSFSVYDAPMEILIGTIFLYSLLGYACLIGLSIAVLFLPLNNWTSKYFAKTQDNLMSARDRRVGLMNEVLNSIRMIKFYAFEGPFEKRVLAARDHELKTLRTNYFLEVMFQLVWGVSPILCVCLSFFIYTSPTFMNQTLTPSTAFASLAIWNELRFSLNVIPDVIQSSLQCLVSLRRIEAYLRLPEIEHLSALPAGETNPESLLVEVPAAEEPDVKFDHATVTWPRAVKEDDEDEGENGEVLQKPFELQDIDVEFPKGEMSLVCGRLGSGKTLLLLSLLGEVDTLSGSITCPRSSPSAIALPSLDWDKHLTEKTWVTRNQTAFVPQQAWLQNASLKKNILFGLPFRQKRYEEVIEACSLKSDLELLEDGDETEIGEKGIALSGGQKARVSLARAVYSRASLLLLDDVLSAVDAHTAKHIYENCLKGPLLAGRTVILVSHHVQLTAPGAARVVELDNGRVKFSGTSQEYLESEGFKAIAGGDEKDGADEPTSPKATTKPLPTSTSPAKQTKPLPKSFAAVVAESIPGSNASSTEVSSASEGEDSDSDEQDPVIDGPDGAAGAQANGTQRKKDEKQKSPRKLIEEESRAVGHVSWAVWKLFFSLMGGLAFWIAFAGVFAGEKLADVAQTWWLGRWSGGADPSHSTTYYLCIYAALSLSAVFISTFQWAVLYLGTLRASRKVHEMLLHSILRAPLRFFDTQALGRIQNRFSKDLEQIDSTLPDHIGRSILYGLGVLTTLTVIASTAPTFLIGFAVLSLAYWSSAKLFSYNAREFRRLDSVSKSPLFSIYGEAVAGVAVIRSFGASARFMALALERTTRNVTFYYFLWGTNRWLSMRYSLLSAVVVALTGYVLIAAGDKVDAALAGFTLTFSLGISNDLLFLVRRWTQLELAMVGVERVKEFSEIKQEAPEIVEPRPPAHWPQGAIEVQNLEIKYAPELPSVLHNLSFSIKAGEKIGIVGATGCGKSTLAASFFRFVEATSGAILIDGLDISKVGLLDLRSRLTIVPQDPVILSGSLRSTLDMFGNYDDHEIFDALRRVSLIREGEQAQQGADATANRSVFWNLDAEVAEGGSNFSTGQRQLLCMARALLRRNKILLLDEATASTDHTTDELITQAIRSEFADCTMMVIAHRLRSVIDFDKILLLDAGKLIEFESPSKLLEDPNSRFHALCRAAGKKEFSILRRMASGKARVTHRPRKPQLWRDIRVSRFTQLPSIEAGSGEENRGRSTLCFTWTGSRSGRRMGSGLQASLLRALSKMSNLYSLAISHACLRVTAFDCAGLTFPSLTCLSLLNVQVSGAAATEIFQPRKLAQLKALSLVDRFWEEQNTKPRQRHVNGPMEWAFLPPLPRFLLDHLDVLQLALADGGLIPKKYLVDPRPPTRWLVRGDAVKIRKHVCQVKPTHLSLEGGWEPFSKYTWREEDIADRAWRLRDLLNAITDNRLQPTSIRSIAFPSLLNLKANRAGGMGEAAIADIIEACKERGIKPSPGGGSVLARVKALNEQARRLNGEDKAAAGKLPVEQEQGAGAAVPSRESSAEGSVNQEEVGVAVTTAEGASGGGGPAAIRASLSGRPRQSSSASSPTVVSPSAHQKPWIDLAESSEGSSDPSPVDRAFTGVRSVPSSATPTSPTSPLASGSSRSASPPPANPLSQPRSLSSAALAAAADTPPRARPPLPAKSAARISRASSRMSNVSDGGFSSNGARSRSNSVASSVRAGSAAASSGNGGGGNPQPQVIRKIPSFTTTPPVPPPAPADAIEVPAIPPRPPSLPPSAFVTPALGLSHPRPRPSAGGSTIRTPALSQAGSTSSSRPSSGFFSPASGTYQDRNSFFSSDGTHGHDEDVTGVSSDWASFNAGLGKNSSLLATPATTADYTADASPDLSVGEEGKSPVVRQRRLSKPAGLHLNPAALAPPFSRSQVQPQQTTPLRTPGSVGFGYGLSFDGLGIDLSAASPIYPNSGSRPSFDGEGDFQQNLDRLSMFTSSLPSPLAPTAAPTDDSPVAGFAPFSINGGLAPPRAAVDDRTLVLPPPPSQARVDDSALVPPVPPFSTAAFEPRSPRLRESSAASAMTSTTCSSISSSAAPSRQPSYLHLPRPKMSHASLRSQPSLDGLRIGEQSEAYETEFFSSEAELDDEEDSYGFGNRNRGSGRGFLGFGELSRSVRGVDSSPEASFVIEKSGIRTRENRADSTGSGLWNEDRPAVPFMSRQWHGQEHRREYGNGMDRLRETEEVQVVTMPPEEDMLDWSERAIERKELPAETTHLNLARCTTPFQIAPLLTLCVPQLTHGLVVLDIGECKLSEIPSAIAQCCFLEELDIHGNHLATGTLPSFLGTLPALRVLLADECNLSTLPSSISQLSRLMTLTLRDNKLRALPSWLCRLEALEALLVDRNPFHFQLHHLVRPLFVEGAVRPTPEVDSPLPASRAVSPAPAPFRSVSGLSPNSSFSGSISRPPLPPGLADSPPGSNPTSPPVASPAFFRSTSGTPVYEKWSTPPPSRNASAQIDLGEIQAELERAKHASESAVATSAAETASLMLPAVLSPLALTSPPLSAAASTTTFAMISSGSEGVDGLPAATGGTGKEKKKGSLMKLMKKVSAARMRSGSQSRPGALDPDSRTYSQPVTREEESAAEELTSKGGRFGSLGRKKKNKPRPSAETLLHGQRGPPPPQKRRSFLMLDAFNSPRSSTPGDLPSPTTESHAAAVKSVLAYLRDLDDLSPDPMALPSIPLAPETAPSAPRLRHSPSLESTRPSLRHSPSLGAIGSSSAANSRPASPSAMRRAQSTRRLPSTGTSPRPQSTRLSQFYDEDDRSSTPLASSSSSSVSPIPPEKKVVDDPAKREAVLKEIVETEQTYLRGLEELCGIYVSSASMPISTAGTGKKDTILPAAERKAVFSNIEAIRDFHRKILLPDLLDAARVGGDSTVVASKVGEVFTKHASFMKIYSSFINSLDDAFARIQTWAKSSSSSRPGTSNGFTSPNLGSATTFDAAAGVPSSLSSSQKKRIRAWLKRCRAHPSHSQISLESYLLLPIQRIPRYRLLLESLSACTPSTASSTPLPSLLDPSTSLPPSALAASAPLEPHPSLVQAVKEMDEVATVLNESKRENEGRAQLLNWQNRIVQKFKSPLVQPYRSLLRTGNLTLTRCVKRSTTNVDPALPTLYRKAPQQQDESELFTLFQETKEVELIALLCTDLLVLLRTPPPPLDQDPNAPVELYTVVRLGSAVQGPGGRAEPPVSLFGLGGDSLRLRVGYKAVMYLSCGDPGSSRTRKQAVEWVNAINLQSELNT
ncbi:hypothetical protein JCM8547_008073 [Rhodosporidiobolus lusitaniae]